MHPFVVSLTVLVSMQLCCEGTLISSEQASENFLGCSIITDCDMDEFSLGSAPAIDRLKSKDRYDPTDCINHCMHFAPGTPLYSYAGVAHKTCYCFDSTRKMKFLKRSDTRCDKNCPETASCRDSHLLYVYTVCPVGKFGPPSCSANCPDHCAPRKDGQNFIGDPVCDRQGHCSLGCKGDYCFTPSTCQILTGGGLEDYQDESKRSTLVPFDPSFYIFNDLCFETDGYISEVEFYGRTEGSAYLGVWRGGSYGITGGDSDNSTSEESSDSGSNNSSDWTLIWKQKLYADVDGVTKKTDFKPDVMKTPDVKSGDCIGIHFDEDLMSRLTADSKALTDYTVLYATESKGAYMMKESEYDDGWDVGDFVVSQVSSGSDNYHPSLSVSITCSCAVTCLHRACDKDGTCRECVPGFEGAKCDQPCPDGYFGLKCATRCPSNCRSIRMEGEDSPELNTCDKISGACIAGCETGYRGIHCDVECVDGHWGPGCVNTCGACKLNTVCDKESGVCPDGCRAGFAGVMCNETCESGTYGEGCGATCGHCKNGETCHPETGACVAGCQDPYQSPTCKCKDKTYGMTCENTCGACANNEACSDDDGQCPFGCVFGKQPPLCQKDCDSGFWGPGCASPCGHCADGSTCDITTGVCPGDCAPGYLGEFCTTPCPQGFYGDKCQLECKFCDYSQGNNGCNNVNGDCNYGCQGGFRSPKCEVCADGYYGDACLKCGNCKDGAQCNSDGTCPDGCGPGVYDSTGCNEVCKPGTWGDNCAETCGHCQRCKACSVTDGHCTNNCEPGYKQPLCDQPCPAGKYGQDCDRSCGHCKNGEQCTPFGVCLSGCDGDYIPPSCEQSTCPIGLWGTRCTNLCGKCKGGVTCHKIDGSCPGPCAEGYTGEFCTEKQDIKPSRDQSLKLKTCDDGTWGESCKQQCGHCVNGENCQASNGYCDECELGYKPPTCTERCDPGKFGSRCQFDCGKCKNGAICNDVNGGCPDGCAPGFHPPSCQSNCADGWYGPECKEQCLHCKGACNFVDGKCTSGCDEGWLGDKCDQAVRAAGEEAGDGTQLRITGLPIFLTVFLCFLFQ